ncbi:MAG: transcriptional regulator [Bryobacteraceae bacterium]|jgi:DNA-binding winged helix-turn-helix (wHTH) protein
MDFRLGAWLIRPELGSLVGDGRASHLTPKAMDVLVCLARRQGQVVSKEEIRREVWPDTYVSDDSLTRCIVELRHAFEDDARQPAIIETIAKRGYRVIPPVTWEEPQPHAPVVARRRLWLPASVAVVLVAAGCALWLRTGPARQRQPYWPQFP